MALDIEITDDLRREGTARELVNRIQNLRKAADFEVTDRIAVKVFADGENYSEIESSLSDFKEYVANQTLAKSVELLPLDKAENAAEVDWSDKSIMISVAKI